jgi:hypothetical protein
VVSCCTSFYADFELEVDAAAGFPAHEANAGGENGSSSLCPSWTPGAPSCRAWPRLSSIPVGWTWTGQGFVVPRLARLIGLEESTWIALPGDFKCEVGSGPNGSGKAFSH